MIELPREYVLTGGRLIDPSCGPEQEGWLHVRDGVIVASGSDATPAPAGVAWIDATGRIVAPGLIDTHVHLREPGFSHKETIATGCAAAAAGGFTAVCCMPNTSPALDEPDAVRWVQQQAEAAGTCRVYVVAAATKGRAGREPVDFDALAAAGAVAFSDDGDGIEDDEVCRQVLEGCKRVDRPFFPHCEFKRLSRRGVMHAGDVCDRLGFPGYDPAAEEAMIERDIRLAAETGARLHVAHISTARGIELLRTAKARGLPVTTEICPHHLLLCDEDVVDINGRPDPNRKMSPPLRSAEDVAACVAAARAGTIDCICTDHAPHTPQEKAADFMKAPMGVVGLETSLGCAAEALLDGKFGWFELIERMSTAPARVLGLPGGTLRPGATADVVLIDPELEWRVDPSAFRSRSRNTAFPNWPLRGKAVATILAGRCVYADEARPLVVR